MKLLQRKCFREEAPDRVLCGTPGRFLEGISGKIPGETSREISAYFQPNFSQKSLLRLLSEVISWISSEITLGISVIVLLKISTKIALGISTGPPPAISSRGFTDILPWFPAAFFQKIFRNFYNSFSGFNF